MIIVLRPNASEQDLEQITAKVRALGLTPHVSRGVTRTVVGCVGDEDRLREVPLLAFPAVETILPVEKPYKLAAREFAARDTEVTLGAAAIGDGAVHAIAGPCSVEGRAMLLETAVAVKAAGAVARRGVQAAHVALLVPRARRPGARDAGGGARGNGAAGRDRGARHPARRARRGARRLPPGGGPQHAELRAARRGVRPGPGQLAGDPVRAGHPHVRARAPQHPRHRGGAVPEEGNAPAGDRGPEPRGGPPRLGPGAGARGRRRGSRRPAHRGPSRSRPGTLGRGSVADAGRVRGLDGDGARRRRGGRTPPGGGAYPVIVTLWPLALSDAASPVFSTDFM